MAARQAPEEHARLYRAVNAHRTKVDGDMPDMDGADRAEGGGVMLAIEAMRQLERHGGGHMMQRAFDGFAQLPPPSGSAQTAPKRPWRTVLGLDGMSGPNFAQLAGAEASYKTLARKHHPDTEGGSHEAMAELNIAINDAREELK
jgi:hypothetical protein